MVIRGIAHARGRHFLIVRAVRRIEIGQVGFNFRQQIKNVGLMNGVAFLGGPEARNLQMQFVVGTRGPLAEIRREMAQRAVHVVKRKHQACQQHGLLGFGNGQAFQFVAHGVEAPRVMFLPGFF